MFYDFLSPENAKLEFWRESNRGKPTISLRCQLGITLWRLYKGATLLELSYHFGISEDLVGRITITWIQFMYMKFNEFRSAMFVPRESHKPLPSHFRNPVLRDCRVVIDCTEVYMELPGDYHQAGNMYSQYKSHSTVKILIGVAPSGGMMFCSDAFEGSISDRQIAIDSNFIDNLHPGDVVLADRGFTIHDLCAKKGAIVEIPSFLNGRPGLEKDENLKGKLLSKARSHIERYNQHIKQYKIIILLVTGTAICSHNKIIILI